MSLVGAPFKRIATTVGSAEARAIAARDNVTAVRVRIGAADVVVAVAEAFAARRRPDCFAAEAVADVCAVCAQVEFCSRAAVIAETCAPQHPDTAELQVGSTPVELSMCCPAEQQGETGARAPNLWHTVANVFARGALAVRRRAGSHSETVLLFVLLFVIRRRP